MMTKTKQKALWIIWLIIWPLAIVLTYQFTEHNIQGNILDILALTVLMGVVALLPINVKGTNLFFIQGISMAVFFRYGLFIELILTQVSVLILLLNLQVSRKEHHRYPLNFLMFLFVSVASGIVYYLLGGDTGSMNQNSYPNLIPMFGYAVSTIFSNQIFLYLLQKFLNKNKSYRFFDRGLYWEALTNVFILPVGLILYMLHSLIGTLAIIYVGIPFVLVAFMLRLYYYTQKVNDLLQKTSEIGQQLTQRLETDDVLELFLESVTKMFPVDYAYILDAEGVSNLKMVKKFEREEGTLPQKGSFASNEGISARVWRSGRSRLYVKRSQWRSLSKGLLPLSANSVISVPTKRNNETVGIITLASNNVRAYEKHHLMVLQILANYLGVARNNAKNYEETKKRSERCPLTNLYNFRYFQTLLELKYSQYIGTPFSVILLDLDHFKKVNDTFGHQSGNDVLCQVADRLAKEVGDRGTVARYGGEEFVILLNNANHMMAVDIAEDIRCSIADHSFDIYNDLENGKRQVIYVTASIGVATAPDQGEDPITLLRNADRAMYTGAKQQGRNKVASYVG
ncbi:GGDEF domain-containing protein [Pseudalkalibacillus caeni]|uniref:GGDEF domain-containing protein n=2 Tax=Exobacillus caeni TaxID=2574798 RepID=A0A5R9FI21_9BACL|nr:GGDEF domain-containing protein [Pseudalkalibacillus caeni]